MAAKITDIVNIRIWAGFQKMAIKHNTTITDHKIAQNKLIFSISLFV